MRCTPFFRIHPGGSTLDCSKTSIKGDKQTSKTKEESTKKADQKPAKAAKPAAPKPVATGRGLMLIKVAAPLTFKKAGSDRELCFKTIEAGRGKITVAEYLKAAVPKCRKPGNAAWYLHFFKREKAVKLEAKAGK